MSDERTAGSGRGHGAAHSGGVEVGTRVRLPRGAEPPIRVYINGVEQSEGVDYRLADGEVRFAKPIVKEGRLGLMRWLSIFVGLVGTYRRNETIDVEYRLAGKVHLASDLPVVEDDA